MTTTSNFTFNRSVLLAQPTARTAAPVLRPAPAAPVAPMSSSLWRHTQNEHEAHTRHGLVARALYGVIAALGAGSVGYALWQTGALMAGNHLQEAVGAFLR